LEAGEIVCSPSVEDSNIRPFGVRLHLADDFLRPAGGEIRLDGSDGDPDYDRISVDEVGELRLLPREFLLASTIEKFKLGGRLVGLLDGRSTLARLGLFIHVSSQVIDGNTVAPRAITLELYNSGPSTLILHSGLAVGMLSFLRSELPSDLGRIHSQYSGQSEAVGPRLGRNFHPESMLNSD